MSIVVANRFRTSLASSLSAGATSMSVVSAGSLSLGVGEYIRLRLTRLSDNAVEFVKCTAISSTTFTIVRAEESSTAIAFASGDRLEAPFTKGVLDDILDEQELLITAANNTAATALATATTANTTAAAALAATVGVFPLQTANLGDEQVTPAKLAAAIAGDGLSGGAGTALAVNVDDSTIEIDSDTLQLKDGGITNVKVSGGYFAQLGSSVNTRSTGTGIWSTGSGTGVVYGGSSNPPQFVYAVISNDHASVDSQVEVRIGSTLSYYSGTVSGDQGVAAYPVTLQNAGFKQIYLPIFLFIPPGYRYCFVKVSGGTPTVVSHNYWELK